MKIGYDLFFFLHLYVNEEVFILNFILKFHERVLTLCH